MQAWDHVRGLVMTQVQLYHPKSDRAVLMFPDASDRFSGSCVTQVPSDEMAQGLPVGEMSHEPPGFVSGAFKGSQLRWSTVDKEGFAIVSTFKRLDYLFWNGVNIYCDHRNLAYICRPAATGVTSKAAAQRLQGWSAYIGQFRYTIVHIPGARNSWGDLLSRWVRMGDGPSDENATVRCMPMLFSHDDAFPTKRDVKQAQQAVVNGAKEIPTKFSLAQPDSEGLYRVQHHDRPVLWIPDDATELQQRLLVSGHMQEAGHRGADATIKRLREYCVWTSMEEDKKTMMRDCLYCADYKTGGMVPRPLEQTVHDKEVGSVVRFDFLHLGRSEVPEAVDSRDGYAYVLVIMEDLSGYT